ncbi:HPr family phosphocarrier protein [Erysipelotrichaceae bacterium OttesenSCG-928-M19]|nr:HPr family phosphocarrier protein [Erysipelotrichaceae bacterium OttesenSCG-928-M19]
MEEIKLTIIDPIGIHAKVAAGIVNIASQYEADVYLLYKNEKANMKSILNILALGISTNEDITIEISGVDELEASQGIFNYFYNNKLAK